MMTVKVDYKRCMNDLDELAKKQVPFAAAVATTRLADKAKQELQSTISNYFIIRNSFSARGVRIERASKRDWPHLSAEVGSIDPYMAMQVTGGVKNRGGLGVVIPRAIRSSKQVLLRKTKWPKAVLSKTGKNKPFIHTIVHGHNAGTQAVAQPVGKGITQTLKVLYLFKPSVKLKARWPMERIVQEIVGQHQASEFASAMANALKTAR